MKASVVAYYVATGVSNLRFYVYDSALGYDLSITPSGQTLLMPGSSATNANLRVNNKVLTTYAITHSSGVSGLQVDYSLEESECMVKVGEATMVYKWLTNSQKL